MPLFLASILALRLLPGGDSLAQEVRSRDAEATSEFLRPPGATRYDETDENRIPGWDQASFYGVPARGRVFVFVVDCSGSMADDARLVRAKAELRRTISRLRWPQRIHIIFFNDVPLPQPGGTPRLADAEGKSFLLRWLGTVEAEGGTEPRVAMRQAIGLAPDAIFLLSDGEFPTGAVESIAAANKSRIPIHCIDLAAGAAGDHLRQIAEGSGGRYAPRR